MEVNNKYIQNLSTHCSNLALDGLNIGASSKCEGVHVQVLYSNPIILMITYKERDKGEMPLMVRKRQLITMWYQFCLFIL